MSDWTLSVEGDVGCPLTLGCQALWDMPQRTVTALLECAGNGRRLLRSSVAGVQWGLGAVGNGEWSGVPLRHVLDMCEPAPGAQEVIFEGADRGRVPSANGPVIPFARSIPLSKALDQDVLLAHRMNGGELGVEYGYPVRAIVPGWYAAASVKWLTRIIVTTRPFQGYYQTEDYTVSKDGVRRPITELSVKAQIARPVSGEQVRAGSAYRVYGAAWTGTGSVATVSVSCDGGSGWTPAQLLGEPVDHAWRIWEYDWIAPQAPGKYTLMARAADTNGNAQPLERDNDLGGYVINHVLPVSVTVA